MSIQLELIFQEEVDTAELFDFVQCWTCQHCYLDIGANSDKRNYKCFINPQICMTRGESVRPTGCKNWTRTDECI